MLVNQSIQMLTIVWNERCFVESKAARIAARRCIARAANSKLIRKKYSQEINSNLDVFSSA